MNERVTRLKSVSIDSGKPVTVRPQEFAPATYTPCWVEPTRNEENLRVAMDLVQRRTDKGGFVAVLGDSGFGKTETTLRWAGLNRCVHMLALRHWRSELPLVQQLCRELGLKEPPKRINDCFISAVEMILKNPKPVFIDEADVIPQHLDMIRQLSMVTGVPFVLIGEDLLARQMLKIPRLWNRTYQVLKFEPLGVPEVIFFVRKSCGLDISPEPAAYIYRSECGGNWRSVKTVVENLVEVANMQSSREVTLDMAETAVRMSLLVDSQPESQPANRRRAG